MAGSALEGIVVARTRLSKVDGEAGRLIYGGYAIEELNPGSLILPARMMPEHMGCHEAAAELRVRGLEGAVAEKTVTTTSSARWKAPRW